MAFLRSLFERAEVVDLAGELAGLAGELERLAVGGQQRRRARRRSCRPASAAQSAAGVLPSGEISPRPVMTTRRRVVGCGTHRPISIAQIGRHASQRRMTMTNAECELRIAAHSSSAFRASSFLIPPLERLLRQAGRAGGGRLG